MTDDVDVSDDDQDESMIDIENIQVSKFDFHMQKIFCDKSV